MKIFFNQHQSEIILTIIIIVSLIILRFILKKVAVGIAKRRDINVHRTTLIVRYINTLATFIVLFSILLIWGIEPSQVALVFSSVFTVIGIGLFATWSILSNITAGVILYFYYPFKIGDKIKILDNDFPIEAVIEDIKTFHMHLITNNGEVITYPNNLILQKSISIINAQ